MTLWLGTKTCRRACDYFSRAPESAKGRERSSSHEGAACVGIPAAYASMQAESVHHITPRPNAACGWRKARYRAEMEVIREQHAVRNRWRADGFRRTGGDVLALRD